MCIRQWQAAIRSVIAAVAAITAVAACPDVAAVAAEPPSVAVEGLKALYRRPAIPPAPPEGSIEAARIRLGHLLFFDRRLSSTGTVACATCHDPRRAFTDGGGRGVTGRPTARAAPTLWNIGFARALFWDGRAGSLEAQIVGPVGSPDEMGSCLEAIARRLGADRELTADFARAFPDRGGIDGPAVIAAIVAFERSLVSPPTRFDRWVEGDASALDRTELHGFLLFAGKAGCSLCHGGWRFTDDKLHDIGRRETVAPAHDPAAPASRPALKTPTLRELAWTAPYMHDGAFPTLDAVVRHYAEEIVDRPTLAPVLRRRARLAPGDRAAIVAFLRTLSSSGPPAAP